MRIGDNVKSETKYTNAGVPRGTMLSPCLFFLYTSDCRGQHENTPIVNADDTGLTGLILITDDDDSHYRQQIGSCVDWCGEIKCGKGKGNDYRF